MVAKMCINTATPDRQPRDGAPHRGCRLDLGGQGDGPKAGYPQRVPQIRAVLGAAG
jgi:hypothetical protein